MPQSNIYLEKEEDDKVNTKSKDWNLSKVDTIKKMIREFKEEK